MATPTPLAIAPVNGATLNTSQPLLEMTLASHVARQKGEWQLATDSAFTANVRTVTEPDSAFTSGSYTSEQATGIATLNQQGTWFVRGRAISELGVPSNWTPTSQVTVTHPPSATSLTPSSDISIPYASGAVTHKWRFFDTASNDYQIAYQVQVQYNLDGSLITDTGKVTSSASEFTNAIPVGSQNKRIRWRVKLWDSNNVEGDWTPWETYWIADIPVVTITSPLDGSTVNNSAPFVQYSLTLGAGRVQTAQLVEFFDSQNAVIYSSGWRNTDAQEYTPPHGILDNESTYRIEVQVRDDLGNVGTDSATITTQWVAPGQPTMFLDADIFMDHGYVHVAWNSDNRDDSFVRYELYRQRDGEEAWELLTSQTALQANYFYKDYLAASNVPNRYRLVQIATRYGAEVNSAPVMRTIVPVSYKYWAIVDGQPELNVRFAPTSDSYSEEWETSTNHLIGRGRQKEIGDRLGYTGSLSVQLRDNEDITARQQKARFEVLASMSEPIYLRNPFGDVWMIGAGGISVNRIAGVGLSEFTDITIEYEELSE